jgi:nicotinamidase-related amidase
MKSIHLVIIDPQRDFCLPNGSLFVPGADVDMSRLAAMIRRLGVKIDDIHITMDSHQVNHIAHPCMWRDSNGNKPQPFTIITSEDVENGIWNPYNLRLRDYFVSYVKSLETNNRYKLCIWPPHCIIGSEGHSLHPDISDAVNEWCENNNSIINFVTKGSNWKTEHYSAVVADVVDNTDPSTQLNEDFIKLIRDVDVILIAGEALSHCLKYTVEDVADNFGEENIKKMVLLTDATSPVPGFEQQGEDFIKKMSARGMKLSNTVDFLS